MSATETASSRQVWFLNTLVNRQLGCKAADWLPQINAKNGTEFFTSSAEWLATEHGVGRDEVSAAISALKGKKAAPAWLAKLTGKTPAPAAAPAAPAPAADPKVMLTQAFLAGKLSVGDFTAAIAALDGAPTPTAEPVVEVEPEVEPEVEAIPMAEPEAEAEALDFGDDDLPF